ncbi:hypothetical protein [Flavobacterium sp. K5-23]|uniref:beta strand repeat-containing protein n=1 Tax=Flavobacterium sp. K5-23 TaxID=2746225 RepID=UPI00200E50E9|nr:hypothetical protein [Flavobacterium sp. K5-23]UQD57193.1 hypothetical protein FLAK523_12645 [Flavobacterium sp. K5-23]
MKKIIILLLLFAATKNVAQTNGITYQAVIMNTQGSQYSSVTNSNGPLVKKNICLVFKFIDEFSNVEYQETVQTKTDQFGMVNLIIGFGTQTSGYADSFKSVVWNTSNKSLVVGINTNGDCSNFTEISNEPFNYVPFAFSALNAENVTGIVPIENGGTNAINISGAKINLGIGNVDNISDVNKPVSIASKAALDLKVDKETGKRLSTEDFSTLEKTKLTAITGTNTGDQDLSDFATNTNLALKANIASPTFTGTVSGIDKTMVGLTNVDNTTDANKPVSTATQTALDIKVDKVTGKGLSTEDYSTAEKTKLTAITGTNTGDQDLSDFATNTNLALKANIASPTFTGTVSGIDKTMVGLTNVDNTTDANKPVSTATQTALDIKVDKVTGKGLSTEDYSTAEKTKLTAITGTNTGDQDLSSFATNTNLALKANIASPTFTGTVSGIDKTMVGLTNVDNTTDANKPVSTATQTALDIKVDKVTGKGLSTEDYSTTEKTKLAAITGTNTGDQDLSSFATNTNLALKANVASPTFTGTVSGITGTMVGLSNVDNTTDVNKPVSTATQTSLDLKANLASPTFTGTVSGIDKTMVGLSNVDNTTDANKPVSTATQTALDIKVDKVTGKGLSTEDYSTTEKTKLAAISGTNTGDQDLSSFATSTDLDLKANIVSPIFTGIPIAPTASSSTSSTQIATTEYVTTAISTSGANFLPLTGGTLTGTLKGTYGDFSSNFRVSSLTLAGSSIWEFGINGTGLSLVQGGCCGRLTIDGEGRFGIGANYTPSYQLDVEGDGRFTSSVTAFSFIKSGGTSSQFLKADGSIDSNTYLTSSGNAENVTGIVAIANGGTGSATQSFVDLTTNQAIDGRKWFNSDIFVNSIRIGNGAGTVSSNLAIGQESLALNTTGSVNIAIGSFALYKNSTAYGNSAVGYEALRENTTGIFNTAKGVYSLRANTTGSHNTSYGGHSLMYNTIGNNNTANGYGSLSNNTTGSNNVAIGRNALQTITAGNSNTALGYYADVSSNSLNNSTAIGNGAIVDASNKIQLGNSSITSVTTTGQLTTGAVTYPNTNGTNGQVLTTDGSGIASWAPGSTVSSLNDLTDAKNQGAEFTGSLLIGHKTTGVLSGAVYNTAVGIETMKSITNGFHNTSLGSQALRDNTGGSRNTAIGSVTLLTNNGYDNTATGYTSLQNNTTGSYNTGIGSEAMNSNTTGNNNTAIGGFSMKYNTQGSNNTGVGIYSLFLNTTGGGNTAVGQSSLISNTIGGYNTGLGVQSLEQNVNGQSNTAIGVAAIDRNTAGSNNAVLGAFAGRYIQDGATYNTIINNSVLIGANTRPKADNGANEIVIGSSAIGKGSNTVQLGNTSVVSVNTSGKLVAGAITYPNTDGTNGQVLTTNGSGTASWLSVSITEVAYEALATTNSQTVFTLANTPSANSKVKMYINGIRISNTAYSVSGLAVSYNAANNGSYNLTIGDRIQLDYYY